MAFGRFPYLILAFLSALFVHVTSITYSNLICPAIYPVYQSVTDGSTCYDGTGFASWFQSNKATKDKLSKLNTWQCSTSAQPCKARGYSGKPTQVFKSTTNADFTVFKYAK
jgi:hypothetical protein